MTSAVLVLNCGSSSLKFALIEPESGNREFTGLAERVGTPEASIRFDISGERTTVDGLDDTSHQGIISKVLARVEDFTKAHNIEIAAVGHRVVHGGEKFASSVLLDQTALDAIRDTVPLAPLHNPANIAGIEAVTAVMPNVAQVGVFDTAFHQSMPEKAYRYAVPQNWYDEHGVRRYGFHGTSHQYVAGKAAEADGRPIENLRIITAHLGNGCSITAIKDGKSVDTSMGLTPLEGLIMGTRSGDIDPGVISYISKATSSDAAAIDAKLNKESGLLGLSGVSNDMRTVEEAAAKGNKAAALALDAFHYRVAKYIASYCVALGGLDLLVFTGGIGENSDVTRADIIKQLGFLGLEIDPSTNNGLRGKTARITKDGDVAAWVIPTDEELVIARDAYRLSR
ncbi:acetate/propionate family kinase [Dermatophilus congolensis]|uniref:acetate/propionate family kinase n=1 Tax=Dermatophilus congolensis TaxID=1863 RepID=UPI001AAF9C69|nr:acetate kinase [Dermatophilus congolensis]MBO3151683.1 acetate kinase [Dermatophilus congolensis]MBO3161317.1 acetate kinase [Dermatophilus congolensis]MBO3162964.1 acetate kinase [Dermatophilus congolensis]MBO3176516.1 acetate kinase [Dermatophilus congolensis]